jgi:formate hydrogenlyase transcriptional activator
LLNAWRESEERVRTILESATEAIFGCDPIGTCIFCNDAAARALGYEDPDELLGKSMHRTEHHTRANGTPYPLEECPIYVGFQKGEGVHRDDEIFWRKDGSSFPVEYWSHLSVRDGNPICVVGFEINNAIITNLTQQALLQSISQALHSVISFDRCAITIYQPDRDAFRFLAVEGSLPSSYFRAGLEHNRTETSAGWVFDHQQSLVRRDLEKEAQYANEHRLVTEGIRSMCAFPLVFQRKCIGTLSLVSRRKDQYSDEDAAFLQGVANQVVLAIQNMQSYEEIASLKSRLEKENIYLREELRTEHNFEEIVGNGPPILAVLQKVEQVAPIDSTVLIYGETGCGKELIARAIHDRSARKNRPLVKVNCSAISAGLVESELFGHVKGAFTGAIDRRVGRFELADGGTIFLDEVGELPLETEVKLLRVLQEREFEPVGSSHSVRVDVRVIAATNRNLDEAMKAGVFRSDLFYRLSVFPIEVPPLRQRRSDIPQLVGFFISRFSNG